MSINKLAKLCYDDAVTLGWYDPEFLKSNTETMMMVNTELCEVVEELRKPEPVAFIKSETGKPEGWHVEVADAVIRLLDFAAYRKIDLDAIIEDKLAYNRTRGIRHGKKF